MARPSPAPPSRRVVVAFAIAAAMGLAVFVVWWLTSPRSAGSQEAELPAQTVTTNETATKPASIEIQLPRGGSIKGWADEAADWLTQATLFRVNRTTDRLEPWLAESSTASPDNLVYTVRLRSNLVWSDGSALTAGQVVAAISTLQVMGKFVGARVIDPRTIEIRFPEPFAPGLRILDRHPIRPLHDQASKLGLGPFVPASALRATPGRPATADRTVVRNAHYWRKAPDGSSLPYIDELTLEPGAPGQHDFDDSAIRVDDYEGLKKLEQSGKVRLFELGAGLDADAVFFKPGAGGQDRPWLGDERFRLAISTAVDRREYCKQVFFGACDPIAGPVSPANIAWFNPDLPLGRGEPQVAREMLAELGLRDRTGDGMLNDAARRPVRFSLLIRGDVPSSRRAAAFLKDTLRAVGVDVIVTEVDGKTLDTRRMKGNYEAIYDHVEFDDTDPAMNLAFWLSSGEAHVWRDVRQSPPSDWERQIDQLMLKNASNFDRIDRLQAFAEVQRIYNQHMPALFFGVPHVRVFTSTRLLNATPSPLRPHLLWNAENLAVLR